VRHFSQDMRFVDQFKRGIKGVVSAVFQNEDRLGACSSESSVLMWRVRTGHAQDGLFPFLSEDRSSRWQRQRPHRLGVICGVHDKREAGSSPDRRTHLDFMPQEFRRTVHDKQSESESIRTRRFEAVKGLKDIFQLLRCHADPARDREPRCGCANRGDGIPEEPARPLQGISRRCARGCS
jgi:hypothetical protein